MEQDILNDYDPDRYTGPDILKTGNDNYSILTCSGSTEVAGNWSWSHERRLRPRKE